MQSFKAILIGTGVMVPAFAQLYRGIEGNHSVLIAEYKKPAIQLPQHQALVEMPDFIIRATEYVVIKRPRTVTHVWPLPPHENTYCAVCEKDLLFGILWGSTITPPKQYTGGNMTTNVHVIF